MCDNCGPTYEASITVSASHVYWAEVGEYRKDLQAYVGGGVYRVPRQGGAVEKLADGPARNIAVDGEDVFWFQNQSDTHGDNTLMGRRLP